MFACIRKLFAKAAATPSAQAEAQGDTPMEKFLIVGLGNIGPDYEGTRHNIGFRMVDALAASVNEANGRTTEWDDRRYGFVTRLSVKGRQLILLKPSTFMNLSGNAVRYWMQQEHVALEHVLVCVDDINLPFGQLRLKPGGSDAGHNGLRHIAQTLGTQQFARLRFGIGNDFFPGQQVDYVLGRFPAEQEALIPECTKATSGAIRTFCLVGIQMAMNQLNRRATPKPSTPTEASEAPTAHE